MTAPSHDAAVQRQFSPQASAYLTSAVHAQGEDLRQMTAIPPQPVKTHFEIQEDGSFASDTAVFVVRKAAAHTTDVLSTFR